MAAGHEPLAGTGGRIRRRPPGRRAQILAAAAGQFHRRGYHQVSMAEVAAEVGITAPALYRHVRNKPELLLHAVAADLAELRAAVRAGAGGPQDLCESLAAAAVDRRALGTLWQRDARLLPAARRAALRRELRADVRTMTGILAAARPGLPRAEAGFLCWSLLSAYGSLSYHTFAPPRRWFERLLGRIGTDLLSVTPAPDVPPPPPGADPVGDAPRHVPSRREELLVAAVRLFHERGFDNVSTDRIGAAVGIAGPSVYNHYATKAGLLAAGMARSRERLGREVGAAVTAAGPDPARALGDALRAYLGFALRHPHYLGVMLSETERLDPPDRREALDFRRSFLRVWVGLLRQVRPEFNAAEARIRVHAMFAVLNDGVRHPADDGGTGRAALLEAAGRAVLGLPPGGDADRYGP